MGKLYAVGFGPGGYEHMTAKAIDVIKNADVITGYTTYVEMLKKFFPDKEYKCSAFFPAFRPVFRFLHSRAKHKSATPVFPATAPEQSGSRPVQGSQSNC